MNEVFQDYMRKFVLVFFDDILVYSKSWSEHLHHLKTVLVVLRSHQLFAKKEKCQFGQKKVQYLGHIISETSVAVDPDKITTMMNWPKPSTLKALRRFLGLTGYYRKFIQNFGKIAGPLMKMLKKYSFFWMPAAEAVFQKLKEAMTNSSSCSS